MPNPQKDQPMTVKSVPTETTNVDPFDLDSLRLNQDFVENVGVKKLLTTVPVRRPHPQEFFRVRPDAKYRLHPALMINLKDDREYYLVRPELAGELGNECVIATLFTTVNRAGVVFLWPVRIPAADGKDNEWWRSQREAADLATRAWVRIKANMALGAYEIATAPDMKADPAWPEESFQQFVEIAFRDRLIGALDHPAVRRLRGQD
jgi:hypothetical protein